MDNHAVAIVVYGYVWNVPSSDRKNNSSEIHYLAAALAFSVF